MKRGLPFALDLFLEYFADSYIFIFLYCFPILLYSYIVFDWLYFFRFLNAFPQSITVFFIVYSFYALWFGIDEVLSIKPFVNLFICRECKLLSYSGGTDRPVELKILDSDDQRFYSSPWLWVSLSCPFGFIYFSWPCYLFQSGFLSIGKFW